MSEQHGTVGPERELGREQSLADLDQALGDREQLLGDRDQARVDQDQEKLDSDRAEDPADSGAALVFDDRQGRVDRAQAATNTQQQAIDHSQSRS